MNIISNTCTDKILESVWFEEWWNEYPDNLFTLTLKITNSAEETTTIVVNHLNLEMNTLPLHLEQGVYSLTLIKAEAGTEESEYLCYFNECDLACEIADKLSEGCEITYRYLTFLRALNLCNQCSCKYGFIAYNNLLKHLGKTVIKINYNDCGCN